MLFFVLFVFVLLFVLFVFVLFYVLFVFLLFFVLFVFVLFCVLFACNAVPLQPGVKSIAFDKYIISYHIYIVIKMSLCTCRLQSLHN